MTALSTYLTQQTRLNGMEFIAEHKWLVKVVVFFAIVGVIRTIELITNKDILRKQDFISLVIVTLVLQIFGAMTK